MKSPESRLKGNIAAFDRHLCLSRQTQVFNATDASVWQTGDKLLINNRIKTVK